MNKIRRPTDLSLSLSLSSLVKRVDDVGEQVDEEVRPQSVSPAAKKCEEKGTVSEREAINRVRNLIQ